MICINCSFVIDFDSGRVMRLLLEDDEKEELAVDNHHLWGGINKEKLKQRKQ